MSEAKTNDELASKLRAVDAWYWAYYNNLQLQSGPFKMDGHEYQVDILRCDDREQCAVKGAQMAFTTNDIIKSVHGLIYGKYPQGVMYIFPSTQTVRRFSQSRFTPLIEANSFISEHIPKTDNVELKRVANANLYFTGGRATRTIEGTKKSSAGLKSEPVDKLVFDEYDEMDEEMVQLALERTSHSEVQEVSYLSTPSIPDFGIDAKYQKSTQNVWMIKCEHCGAETCLEIEFPNCLEELKDGRVIRVCKKCKKEIFSRDGKWVSLYPDRKKDLTGWWISQLNSAYVDPKKILEKFNNPPLGNITEVYNSKLGRAYIASENKLTVNDVYGVCSRDPMFKRHAGPTCMGVDVGRYFHVVIGSHPTSGMLKAIFMARVSELSEVHRIAKDFNVQCGVIDSEPEKRKARDFQDSEDYEMFLFDYNEFQRHAPNFDSKNGVVTMNRTELCDATHDLIVVPGRYEIPSRCEEVEQYAKEMANIAKVLDEDAETGSRRYKYKKLGADDYRHATNYMLLAAMRIGISRGLDGRKTKDAWDDSFEDSENISWMAA